MQTCPTCNGPMKVLFTGFYCPKDCDRKSVSVSASNVERFMFKSRPWQLQILHTGDQIPGWATRGFWVYDQTYLSNLIEDIQSDISSAWILREPRAGGKILVFNPLFIDAYSVSRDNIIMVSEPLIVLGPVES